MKPRIEKQYTIRGIPPEVDRALRRQAERESRSLNEVTVDALRRGAGLGEQPVVHHDLDHLAGTWVDDAAFDAAIAAQDVVDERLWR